MEREGYDQARTKLRAVSMLQTYLNHTAMRGCAANSAIVQKPKYLGRNKVIGGYRIIRTIKVRIQMT